MTGIAMMLKSLGIKVDPTEIESAFAQAKAAIPEIVTAVQDVRARQQRIENDIANMPLIPILKSLLESNQRIESQLDLTLAGFQDLLVKLQGVPRA